MINKTLNNEQGIALVFVLILSLIGLGIVSALLYMTTLGTRTSGAEKFYRTADSAALGGAKVATDLILQNFANPVPGALSAPLAGALGTALGNQQCLAQKISLTPGAGFANWTQCAPAMTNLDATDNPDMSFTLAGVPTTYTVFAKVIDTVDGNTAGGSGLSTGGVGGGGTPIATPQRRSWMYRIEVEAQNDANLQERSRYSVLFAH